jgi:quinol monooxygenase YgiN
VALEVVHIVAKDGVADDLARDYQPAIDVIMRSPGARSAWVARQREDPQVFALYIDWESVEAHEAFRETPLLAEFRACVGQRVGEAFGGHYDVIARG